MNKEDLVNLWDAYLEDPKLGIAPNFGSFMKWLKANDSRTEANPYIYTDRKPTMAEKQKWYADPTVVNRGCAYGNDDCPRCESEKRVVQGLSSHVVGRRSACLTGQEWYDRFSEEYVALEGRSTSGGTGMPRTNALVAARKAAGLDENGEIV